MFVPYYQFIKGCRFKEIYDTLVENYSKKRFKKIVWNYFNLDPQTPKISEFLGLGFEIQNNKENKIKNWKIYDPSNMIWLKNMQGKIRIRTI